MTGEERLARCARKSTDRLFGDLRQLDGEEGEVIAEVLAHLIELDRRDAIAATAYPTLFAFCTKKLGYSEAEAFLRSRAAKAAARFPRVLTMIEQRRIHLTAVARLQPHLTPENYRSLLDRASRRSLEELGRLIAELAPLPEKRPVIRALSVDSDTARPPSPAHGERSLFDAGASAEPRQANGRPERPSPSAAPVQPAADVRPEPPRGRVLFNFTASEEFRRKFCHARALLWHKYPHGRPEDVFGDALEALLERKDPMRRMDRRLRRARRAIERAAGLALPA